MHLFLWTLVCHKCHHLWRSQSSKFGAKLPLRPCYWEKYTQKMFRPRRCFTNLREALWWHPGSSSDRILFEDETMPKSQLYCFSEGYDCNQPMGDVLIFSGDVVRDDDSILNFARYTLYDTYYIHTLYVILVEIIKVSNSLSKEWLSGWWFQIFFIFIPIGERFPFRLIFFRWVVSTTNQLWCDWLQMNKLFTPSIDDGELLTIPRLSGEIFKGTLRCSVWRWAKIPPWKINSCRTPKMEVDGKWLSF